MNPLINLAGLVSAIYLFFEFIVAGNAFLMFLGFLLIAIGVVASFNSWQDWRKTYNRKALVGVGLVLFALANFLWGP